MTARRDSVDEPEAGSSGGRALLIGAVVFAVAATGLLVLADEMKWLRLGIVAALWAALVGAFLAAKYRRQLSDQEDALADRQELYELELEREIAARREYELEAVAEAKREAEEQSRDDIAALRGELQSLRTTLESLLGGEFLVERYALRAESTRMRSLPDDRQLKRLPAAVGKDEIPSVVREAETDLIERIREVHQAPRREPQRPQPQAPPLPQPQRAEPRPAAAVSQPLPKPQPRPDRPVGRTDRPAPEPSKPVKRVEPVVQARRAEPPPHPAEVSDRWFIPGALDENGAPRRQPTPPPPVPTKPPPQPAYDRWEPELSEIEEEWTPSWEAASQARRHEQPPPRQPEPVRRPEPRPEPLATGGHPRPENGRRAQPADSGQYAVPAAADPGRRARQEPAERYAVPAAADLGRRARQVPAASAHQETEVAMRPVEPPAPTHDPSQPVGHTAEQTSWLAQYNQPKPASLERPDPLDYRARPYRTHAADSGQFPVVDDLPPSGRRHARTEPEGDSGGGRRRRAEGQPTWQELQSGGRNGHARPEPVEEPTGSHAAGRSVNELLATHGLEPGPRRRRRRED